MADTFHPSGTPRAVPLAYTCVNNLARWLDIGIPDLLHALGIPPETYDAWAQHVEGPRPGTTGKLYPLHALAAALVDTLGETAARTWLVDGEPSRRDLFLAAARDRPALDHLAALVRDVVVPRAAPAVNRSLAARPDGETTMPGPVLDHW